MEQENHAPLEQMYTASRVAILIGVTPDTVWRWVREGTMQSVVLGTRQVRIPESEVRRILSKKRGEIIKDSIFD